MNGLEKTANKDDKIREQRINTKNMVKWKETNILGAANR